MGSCFKPCSHPEWIQAISPPRSTARKWHTHVKDSMNSRLTFPYHGWKRDMVIRDTCIHEPQFSFWHYMSSWTSWTIILMVSTTAEPEHLGMWALLNFLEPKDPNAMSLLRYAMSHLPIGVTVQGFFLAWVRLCWLEVTWVPFCLGSSKDILWEATL